MTSGNISRHKVSLSAFPKHSFRASARTISCAAPPGQKRLWFSATLYSKTHYLRQTRKRSARSPQKIYAIFGKDGAHTRARWRTSRPETKPRTAKAERHALSAQWDKPGRWPHIALKHTTKRKSMLTKRKKMTQSYICKIVLCKFVCSLRKNATTIFRHEK